MLNLIDEILNKHSLTIANQKIVIGVSTGVDSMVLLNLLEKTNAEIIVCHVNHKKRLESDIEEEFIKKYCSEKGIKLYIKSLKGYIFTSNFQEQARVIRTNFFYEVMEKEKSKFLFLAHHLNDDMETSFMRIIRGSSLSGFSGIKELSFDNNIYIIRPLLSVLKKDIIEYAITNDIKFFDDKSNFTNEYTRNRIRHNLIPILFEENKNYDKTFLDFKETLIGASKLVEEVIDNKIKEIINFNSEFIKFDKFDFLCNDLFVQREILFKLLKQFSFSKKNIDEIIKYINSDKQNLRLNYKQIGFLKEYNDISIYYKNLIDQEYQIVVDEFKDYVINEKFILSVTKKNNNFISNLSKIWYNSKDLPVVVRNYHNGDSLTLGYGTKKVSRLLIDKKVPIQKRKETLVLEKDGEILAVFNYAKSIKLNPKDEYDMVIELKEIVK